MAAIFDLFLRSFLKAENQKQESQNIDSKNATNTCTPLIVSQNQSSREEEVSKGYVNDEFVAKLSKEFDDKNGEWNNREKIVLETEFYSIHLYLSIPITLMFMDRY